MKASVHAATLRCAYRLRKPELLKQSTTAERLRQVRVGLGEFLEVVQGLEGIAAGDLQELGERCFRDGARYELQQHTAFVDAVRAMRNAQRAYFQLRTRPSTGKADLQRALTVALEQEMRADRLLQEL